MSAPSLLAIRSFKDLQHYIILLLTDFRYFSTLAFLVTVGDAVLTQLIIRFVSYTEIDWETYMYQVELYIKGERDYALISGPTGPLVYPAGHVHIHRWLYSLTGDGTGLATAQQIYALLYIVSLALTCAIYHRAGGVPNWILLLLPLSKRLHSIFVLRLFNDCWALIAVQAATLAFSSGFDGLGIVLFSLALSVKMSVLLYLPGVLVILFKRGGLFSTVRHLLLLVATQALVGWPFLTAHPRSYLKYSFEFSRIFLYKWTVNWRFLPEDAFLSSTWAKLLLLGHIATLLAFGWFKWCQADGGVWAVISRGLRSPNSSPSWAPLTADYVITVLFTSNLIGVLFARSLHYQFYSWYAQQLPFLMTRVKYPWLLKFALLISIEYAWNKFPSTPTSSAVLLMAHSCLLLEIWRGCRLGKARSQVTEQKIE